METELDFKRMVLGLPHSAKDYASVAFTAELAELLGLDLVGVFAEDQVLADVALLPCAREFRLSGDGWHRFDVEQLTRSSSQAAAEARRLFGDVAKARLIAARFDFVRGQIGEAIGLQSLPDDILVVIEPRNPAERVTHQFRQFMEMALSAPTATLFIPSHISRRKGQVVALAINERDPSIQVGLGVAEAARERLLVLTADMTGETISHRSSPTVQIDQRLLSRAEFGLPDLVSTLGMTGERLFVMSRGSNSLLPPQIASERGVPVLVTAQPATARRPVA